MSKVTFWLQLNQVVVAQKGNEFFSFPKGFMPDEDCMKSVAEQFDTAPLKSNNFDIVGAVVIHEVEVD